MLDTILVFDVESVGDIFGEGFCVGAFVFRKIVGETRLVVVDQFFMKSAEGALAAEMHSDPFVKKNVLPYLFDATLVPTNVALRDAFNSFLSKYRDDDGKWKVDVYTDVPFPVETNFLAAIVMDNRATRTWCMPYPLFCIKSICDHAQPISTQWEICGLPVIDEHPHNPLYDIVQSVNRLTQRFDPCINP